MITTLDIPDLPVHTSRREDPYIRLIPDCDPFADRFRSPLLPDGVRRLLPM